MSFFTHFNNHPMLRFEKAFMLFITLIISKTSEVSAIFQDEVGKFDFLISTAGHGGKGGVTSATFLDEHVIITSGDESCYVSGRNVTDGNLLWRRNSCSGKDSVAVTTTLENEVVVTLDSWGVIRGMSGLGGEFLFDSNIDWMSSSPFLPKLFPVSPIDDGNDNQKGAIVVVGSSKTSDQFSFLSDITGESLMPSNQNLFLVEQLLQTAKIRKNAPNGYSSKDGQPKIISVQSKKGSVVVLIGWVFSKESNNEKDAATSLSNMAFVEYGFPGGNLVQIKKPSSLKSSSLVPIVFSSIKLANINEHISLLGAVKDDENRSSVIYAHGISGGSTTFESINLPSDWKQVISLKFINSSSVSISGKTKAGTMKMALFLLDEGSTKLSLASLDEENIDIIGVQTCSNIQNESIFVLKSSQGSIDLNVQDQKNLIGTLSLEGVLDLSSNGDISSMSVYCSPDTNYQSMASVFLTTTGGTSAMVTFSLSPTLSHSSWVQEENLASITDAVFLDRSSLNENDDHESDANEFSLNHRLYLQLDSVKTSISTFSPVKLLDLFSSSSLEARHKRDFHFGFAKVAVVLSSTTGRLFGLDTLKRSASSDFSPLLWSIMLNPEAISHKLVYGGSSSNSGVDGGLTMYGSNEVLILSTLPENKLEYKCVDGIHGRVHSSGYHSSSSDVSQIIPVRSDVQSKEQGGCKQLAILLNEDGTVDVIPNTDSAIDTVKGNVNAGSKNGFYAHTINEERSSFESFKIIDDTSGTLAAERLGETLFEGEKIVKVSYPLRGEVVTSPATILGDDSLLLKYLNPHLVVVVTHDESDDLISSEVQPNPFESALQSRGSGSGKTTSKGSKIKPVGATNGDDAFSKSKEIQSKPNLFINLVDSVSSKILHRVSHSFGSAAHPISVIISENWIIYTYFNTDTKRTDIGVLTLHEGMIDKNGITAFNSQVEQELEFSSFTSEKPIVLNKMYTLGQPKGITSLGITQTTRGISSKHVLFALGSNQVLSVDRRWLDPRRPSGEPKKTEKAEGLQRYVFFSFYILRHIC